MWELGNILLIRTGNFRRVQEGEQERGEWEKERRRGVGAQSNKAGKSCSCLLTPALLASSTRARR